MIVLCPSCHNRYRHDFQAAAQVAHCAACDERFEPVPPKRTYVLVPGGSVPETGSPPAAIGMDDPLLAGKLLDVSIGTGSDAPAAVSSDAAPSPESDGRQTEGRVGPGLTAALELAVAVVPCVLGAGLAYYFAGSLNQDPIIAAILGGVTGLLLGWACVIWIAQAD